MLDEEILDKLDGMFAYDMGCVSSGIYDPGFKNMLIEEEFDLEPYITELAKMYLNSVESGYTIKDIHDLISWWTTNFSVDI